MPIYLYTVQIGKVVKDYFIPPVAIEYDSKYNIGDILIHGRERILTALFRFSSILAILGFVSIMGPLLKKNRWDIITFYLIMAFIVIFISFNRKIKYGIRCFFFLIIVYIMAVIDLVYFGIAEDCRLYLFAFAVLMTIFLGWKSGIIALIIGQLTFIFIAWQILAGNLVITASLIKSPIPTKSVIFAYSLLSLMITGIVVSAVAAVMREFEVAWSKERLAVGQLELRVIERTNELNEKNKRLVIALEDIKTLNGLLPICVQCKKIRDDKGYWSQIESYIEKHSDAAFSHGLCPECSDEFYGNEAWYLKMKKKKKEQ